jgi:hypothetical protein
MDSNTDNDNQNDNEFTNEPRPDNQPIESTTEQPEPQSSPEPMALEPMPEQAAHPQHVAAVDLSQPETSKFKALLKKPLFYVGLVVVVGLIIGAILLTGGDDDEVAVNTEVETVVQERVTTLGASVVLTEGTVELSSDGEEWTEAAGGESLAQSDYVRTQEASRAIILFDDGSIARLDNTTELWLSSLEPASLEITLVSGQVYTRVVESEKLAFTVVTSNDRYESLGTAYKTSTDGTEDSLEVYQSEVKVVSQEVEVSEGNKYDTTSKEVAALDLSELDEDEFAQWNKQKDSESEDFKDKLGVLKDREEASPAQPTNPSVPSGITLSATELSDGVKLSWTLQGVSSQQGFKIVRSSSDSTPTFGENDAQYEGDPAARSRVWASEKGGAHYYRVCIYFEGSCSTYSNSVKANSPAKVVTRVISGGVTLAIDGKTVSWTLSGGNAPHGYKVLLNTSPSPTYPSDSILYSGSSSVDLPSKEPGTYYVRVCKYTNGSQAEGCVDYSNEVQYVVSTP